MNFEFYASEVLRFLEELATPGLVDWLGAIGPTLISCIALWLSWRGSKNTEAIQKQIATAEGRASLRKVLLEAHSTFFNHDIEFLFREGLIRIPGAANNLSLRIAERHLNMITALKRVELVTMGDNSDLRRNLLTSIRDALCIYGEFSTSVTNFVGFGECLRVYNDTILCLEKEYGKRLTPEEIIMNYEKMVKFMSYSHCDSIRKMEEICCRYERAVSDDNFNVHFQKYLDNLSK